MREFKDIKKIKKWHSVLDTPDKSEKFLEIISKNLTKARWC
jgi:hypothetical protein